MGTTSLVFVLVFGLLDGPSTSGALDAYREQRASAARTVEDQVRLALWCEQRGLDAERIEHLSMALGINPDHATARALLGMVKIEGKWRTPESVKRESKESDSLHRYEAHRNATPPTAPAQWKLSIWCDKNGLKPQAEAHATAAIRLDPNHVAARNRLGFKQVSGQWQTELDIAREQRRAIAQERADRKWGPTLTRWRTLLKQPGDHSQIQTLLAGVEAPLAVRSIARIFGTELAADQSLMVQLLGQIEGRNASEFLATAAMFGATNEVRRAAAETLIRRDPRDFLGLLIEQMRDIVRYEAQPVGGPEQAGVLLIDRGQEIVRRRYTPPSLPLRTRELIARREAGAFATNEVNALELASGRSPSQRGAVDSRGVRVIAENRREALRAAESAQRQLERDIAILDRENNAAGEINTRVLMILTNVTGMDLAPDRGIWSRWWADHQGYAYVSPPSPTRKPVVDVAVNLEYRPQFVRLPARTGHSCFAAGTQVRTRQGLRSIESIQVGDEVLSQDVHAGTLEFQPVVMVYHNPLAPTIAVNFRDETIVSTGIHRFWVTGKGWVMARDLRPGDRIRAVGASRSVGSLSDQIVQPVFNLEVATNRTFFVGDRGALVHDHSLVESTPEPFDSAVRGQRDVNVRD